MTRAFQPAAVNGRRQNRLRSISLLFGAAVILTASSANGQFIQSGPKLVGSGAAGSAFQGNSVSISRNGTTIAIGGQEDAGGRGAVWVYTRNGGAWIQQAKLVGREAVSRSSFGASVALSGDGDTLIAGAPYDSGEAGAVWFFTRIGAAWSQQGGKQIGAEVSGPARFGVSVALSDDGNTAAVGGPAHHGGPGAGTGATWVFRRANGSWSQMGPALVGQGAAGGALQGCSVAISGDGNTVLAGGLNDDAGAGAAWVFTRSENGWTQQGPKLAGAGAEGDYSFQGSAVSLSADGSTAILGAPADKGSTGAAWLFVRSGASWRQQDGKIVGTGAAGLASQGGAVALSADGRVAMIGGPQDRSPRAIGATWVYERAGSVWTQQGDKLVGSGTIGMAQQGRSVALSGDGRTAVIGGMYDNDGAGAAWVFVSDPPARPSIAAVANGASFATGTISSGSWTSIFGTGLAPAGHAREWNNTDFAGGRLPLDLDGTSVTVNGKAAPVAFIHPNQVNILTPDAGGTGPLQIVVTTAAGATEPFTVNSSLFSPGLFAATPPYLLAQHADGRLVNSAAPAAPGEVIVLWGTGFGPSEPSVATDRVFAGAAPLTNPVTIRFGSEPAIVDFAGLVANGLVQINVRVPIALQGGDIAVTALAGEVSSQTVRNLIPVQ